MNNLFQILLINIFTSLSQCNNILWSSWIYIFFLLSTSDSDFHLDRKQAKRSMKEYFEETVFKSIQTEILDLLKRKQIDWMSTDFPNTPYLSHSSFQPIKFFLMRALCLVWNQRIY